MKGLFLIVLWFSVSQVFGQTRYGTVKDAVTQLPIANAQVHTKNHTVLTDKDGRFALAEVSIGDRFSVRLMGYAIKELKILNLNEEPIVIYLYLDAKNLNTVVISAKRNYQKDSIAIRKEFASVFAYKPPNYTDMFVKVDPNYRSPHANINPNSTASILRFNALSAFKLFGKKNKNTIKLKQNLLNDEAYNSVNNAFSTEKVMKITSLSGQALTEFMNKYRPNPDSLRKMSDYELHLYIKRSYNSFLGQKQ